MRYKWLQLTCFIVILGQGANVSAYYERNVALQDTTTEDGLLQESQNYQQFSSNTQPEQEENDKEESNDNTRTGKAFSYYEGQARNTRKPVALTIRPRPSQAESSSSICSKTTENYDCQLRDIHLGLNETKTFGLAWKNNPQKNITFRDSRMSYLPKSLFDAFPQMEMLNAGDLQIEMIENYAFKNARNLKFLYLHQNLITIITGFKGVPLLEILNLSNNKITQIENNAFERNQQLQNIKLNFNQISELPNFQNLLKLETLDISNNKLQSISDDQFSMNNLLKSLNVSSNELENFNLQMLDSKTNLYHVDVSFNKLTSLYIPERVQWLYAGNNSIRELEAHSCEVEKLYLAHNQISSVNPLQSCGKITTLDLSYNMLETFDDFRYFPMLEFLKLAHNQLFEIGFTSKAPHPLQILDLSNNFVCYGPSIKFPQMKALKLNNNYLIRFDFSSMKALNYLQLSGNEWSCDNIDKILLQKEKLGITNDGACATNFRSLSGICCRDYDKPYNDRLKELVREINLQENLNKQDQKECTPPKPSDGRSDIDLQKLHDETEKLDSSKKQTLREIEVEKSKIAQIDEALREGLSMHSLTESRLKSLDSAVERQRSYYGVIKEGLISSQLTLDRVVEFTRERNTLSEDLLASRTGEKETNQERLNELNDEKVKSTTTNESLKDQLTSLKKNEADLKKERQKLERDLNRNAQSLHGSKSSA